MPKGLKGAAFVLGGILFVAAIAVFAVLAGDRLPRVSRRAPEPDRAASPR